MEQAETALQNDNGVSQYDTPQTISVKVGVDANGSPIMKEMSIDEISNGLMMQSDYTRKTQELARKEKELLSKTQPWLSDDDAVVEQYLDAKGFVKKETVESLVEQKLKWLNKSQQDEQSIQQLLAANPDLKQFEWAIKKIAATDDSAIEDIVVKYGFSSHDKLSKAKQRWLVGGSNLVDNDKPKPVSEWTKEDWTKFEAQQGKSQFR